LTRKEEQLRKKYFRIWTRRIENLSKFKQFFRDLAEECREEYERLSEKGKESEDIGEGVETVTEVDERMTDVIIEAFQERSEDFGFQSEELKKESSEEEESDPDYTVIFDEIDGTANMKNDRGPFGPIVGIAEGSEPEFKDIEASMFYDLRNNDFYEAYKDEGAFLNSEKLESADKVPEEKSKARGLLDQAMLGSNYELAEPLWKYPCKDFGSMGYHLVLVGTDRADFMVTGGHGYVKDENTAEEIAPLYLFLQEAGAVMTDWKGENIGEKSIGMSEGLSHDVIAASTQGFAEEIAEDIQNYIR
jgi:fructose-1,6-bisphosphatase/inositol monophosphatase family enzyme